MLQWSNVMLHLILKKTKRYTYLFSISSWSRHTLDLFDFLRVVWLFSKLLLNSKGKFHTDNSATCSLEGGTLSLLIRLIYCQIYYWTDWVFSSWLPSPFKLTFLFTKVSIAVLCLLYWHRGFVHTKLCSYWSLTDSSAVLYCS